MTFPTFLRHRLLNLSKKPLIFCGIRHYDYMNQSDEVPCFRNGRAVMLTPCPDTALSDATKGPSRVSSQSAILAFDASSLRAAGYRFIESYERGVRRVYVEEPIVDASLHILGVLMVDDIRGRSSAVPDRAADAKAELEMSVRETLHHRLMQMRAKVLDTLGAEDDAASSVVKSLDGLLMDVAFGPRTWPMVSVAQ